MFGNALVTLSMAFSTIFQDSKIAGMVGSFVVFLPVSFFIFAVVQRMSHLIKVISLLEPASSGFQWFQLTYLLPHFSFGVISADFFSGGNAQLLLGVDPTWAWVALILTTPAYILLYVYLDQVIPNEFGISKPCLYPCRKQ